jgi:hypothetical protein
MSIETTLAELIAALNANTEALKAVGTTAPAAAPAPAARAPRGSKAAAATKEEAPAPEPAAEPAKEEAPANVTPITPPAAKGPTANDLKKLVKDERTRLADVSGEAVKKHKEESAKILKSFGLVDFTSIPDDKVADMMAAFKALDVEKPAEKDELEDDDDGL